MVKTKAEKAKSNLTFLFPFITSFKITSDNAIAGKSELGDCIKNKNIGKINNIDQAFFSKI